MSQLRLAHSNASIVLAQELGRGGEGVVFSIRNVPDWVAKLYTGELDATKVKKLSTMVEASSPALLRIAAWPIDLLVNVKRNVCGFVMPRVFARRDIHELYSPKSRSEAFPETDFRFLVHVGANIARAFAIVHAQGHVIGDVNHGNLLVGTDGTVMLIDCDSFQVGQGTDVFSCDVGVPLFTAPELHGRPLRGLVRTPNHDFFGLAVLLFHMLCMGRHPFAGRFLGQGDMPIERAVAEYRFAYGPDRAANAMERPPGTISLETMGSTVCDLFVRAFERAGAYGGRPTAVKWIEALVQMESSLRVCARTSCHHYPRELPNCPWCAIEALTGARLFGQHISASHATRAVDIATLWQAIATVPVPGADPSLPSERPWQAPPGFRAPKSIVKSIRKVVAISCVISGLVACNYVPKQGGALWAFLTYFVAYLVWPHVSPAKKVQAERAWRDAKAEWENIVNRWRREASKSIFHERFQELERLRIELEDLPTKRQQRINILEAERERCQLQRYLDRFHIDRADIGGIGPSRKAMLASYGIETATDVDREAIRHIPGFGQKLTRELLKWRKDHEKNFRFNPNEPINRRDVEALDKELEAQKVNLITMLQQGPDQLRRLSAEIANARTRLMPLLERIWSELNLAEAVLKVV